MKNMKRSRLRKVALMPTQMFQSQLDQISDKGRDVLKTLEEYKFFVEQTSRVMKNDPALTEVIMGKKKNLEEASTKIYDIVFDIENLDITSLYERQQEVTNENQGIEAPQTTPASPESENDAEQPKSAPSNSSKIQEDKEEKEPSGKSKSENKDDKEKDEDSEKEDSKNKE